MPNSISVHFRPVETKITESLYDSTGAFYRIETKGAFYRIETKVKFFTDEAIEILYSKMFLMSSLGIEY